MIPKDLHIPGYDIDVLLGKGGMAAVYKARQQSFGREVALKVLNPAVEDLEDFSQRFLRESMIVAKLHHSHIVQVYDVGQYENYFYISMEYLHGGDLSNKIREGITLKESVNIVRQLADALDFAHRKNIIHRDIKPENIMFREDGAAVLTDFGIAKELESQTNLTQTGLIIGTPKYMSPEHIRGEEVDHRADIYALGIVFYRCLTNYVPFDGKDMVTTAYLQNNEPVPNLPPQVSCFQDIINRMLEKAPEDRFQRGRDIADALEQIDRKAYTSDLTNLDVADASKLAPPTVTRTASGRHSVKTPRPIDIPGMEVDSPARSEGTQLRARVVPNETIRADHMSPVDLLLDEPLDEPAQTPPQQNKSRTAVVIWGLIFLGAAGYSANHYREELARGAWPEVIADVQHRLFDTWTTVRESVNGRVIFDTNETDIPPIEGDEAQNEVVIEPSPDLPAGETSSGDLAAESLDVEAAVTSEPVAEVSPPEEVGDVAENIGITEEAPAEPDLSETIAALLNEAEIHLTNRRLRKPADDNAFLKYQQVLELEADNSQAIAGLAKIAKTYFVMAERAIAAQQFDAARGFLTEAYAMAPDDPELQKLEAGLAAAIAEQKEREIQAAAAQRAAQIEELLMAAKSDEKAGRIRAPVGNNALEKYQQILDMDPDHDQAIDKLIEYGR